MIQVSDPGGEVASWEFDPTPPEVVMQASRKAYEKSQDCHGKACQNSILGDTNGALAQIKQGRSPVAHAHQKQRPPKKRGGLW